ncbi:hypothetical protein [Nitrospira sp. KM1]|uniref:hypothetical protein n=1 Tax=Nitrospira sp. KM1 TaxID=1936990 RepID=UPI001566AA30|nr:hypothetical protein [Nitrospira sp. KM1]
MSEFLGWLALGFAVNGVLGACVTAWLTEVSYDVRLFASIEKAPRDIYKWVVLQWWPYHLWRRWHASGQSI